MRKSVINIGRVRSRFVAEPWFMWCPLCPTLHGFAMHRTHEIAIDAKDRHLFKHHPDKFAYVEVWSA